MTKPSDSNFSSVKLNAKLSDKLSDKHSNAGHTVDLHNAKLSDKQWQVLATLCYTSQFGYPLTSDETAHRLVTLSKLKTLKVKLFDNPLAITSEIDKILFELKALGLIQQSESWWYISGFENHVQNRVKNGNFSKTKWQEAAQAIRLLSYLPWIESAWITGALAMDNACKDDDIDWMIVTTPGRLWLTRLLVLAVAAMSGKRRSWRLSENNTWCFNLWLETTTLAMEKPRQNFYTAYEILQAVPVLGSSKSQSLFYEQNLWIEEWLSSAARLRNNKNRFFKKDTFQPIQSSSFARIISAATSLLIISQLFTALNSCAYWMQRSYMKRHQTFEKVGLSFAFFHPRDTAGLSYQKWQDLLTLQYKKISSYLK